MIMSIRDDDFFRSFYLCSVFVCPAACEPLEKDASGLFTCFALHKKALYTGGSDGTLCQLQIIGNHALVTAMYNIGVPITSLHFNSSHHKLAVGSRKVSSKLLSLSVALPGLMLSNSRDA